MQTLARGPQKPPVDVETVNSVNAEVLQGMGVRVCITSPMRVEPRPLSRCDGVPMDGYQQSTDFATGDVLIEWRLKEHTDPHWGREAILES